MADDPTDETLFIQFTPGPEADVPLPPDAPPPKDPSKRYTVAEVIGKGGMAEIHRAVDMDLRRIVAMKAMRGDQPMGLFIREARLTAQLEHPNIVPIHDVGVTGERNVFFTMKLVGGRTFHEVLDEAHRGGESDLRPLLDVLLKVCDAMAFAHSRGVVHRDLKPANIMVGEYGEVLVMDWGLALVTDLPDVRGETIQDPKELGASLDGHIVGTPSYMAPEQARGEPVDGRTDVYALGAILYQVLVGVPPVTGGTLRELIDKAESGSFPRPEEYLEVLEVRAPERVARLKARGIPPELTAVAMKALAHEPGDRYESVKAFQADIRRFLTGHAVSVRRDPIPVRVVKWIRRNPVPSVAVAVALVALAVGLGFARFQASMRAAGEVRAAEALMGPDATIDKLMKADEHLRRAEALGADVPRRYDVNLALGERALEGGDYALARMAFSVCRSIDSARAAGLDARVTDAEQAEARRRAARIAAVLAELRAGLSRRDRPPGSETLDEFVDEVAGFRDEQTVQLLDEALEPFRKRSDPLWTQEERDVMAFAFRVLGHPGWPGGAAVLASMLERLDDHELAVECGLALCSTRDPAAHAPLLAARDRLGIASAAWAQISRQLARVPEPADTRAPSTASEYFSRALYREDRGDVAGAIADLTRAIELNGSYREAFINRGTAYYQAGELEKALDDYDRAVELKRDDPDARNNRGNIRFMLGDAEGALEDFNEAIRLHPSYGDAIQNRGSVLTALGRFQEAITDYTRAIAINPTSGTNFMNRGVAYYQLGDHERAIEDYTWALRANPNDPMTLTYRAAARLALGRTEEALDDCNRAIRVDAAYAPAFQCRGNVRSRMNDLEGAVADWERCLKLDPNGEGAAATRDVLKRVRDSMGPDF